VPSILDDYWNELGERFTRRPVWLPGTPMDLGDIGILRKGGWEKVADLESIGIRFSREPAGPKTAYSYSSAKGAEITVRAKAETSGPMLGVAKGNSALGIKFSRRAAFVLMVEEARVERIANLQDVDRAVLDAYRASAWQGKWIYVSEVVAGAPALTVISATAEGEAVVDLGAAPLAGATELGHVQAGAGFGYKKDLAASFLTTRKSAVMWRGHYVRDPLVGNPAIRERGDWGRSREPSDVPAGLPALVEELVYLSDVLSEEERQT
jgi:hypothetical protein